MIRPWLLRPPVFGFGDTRDFSGVVRVTSTKSATLEPRRPGVVGLYLRIPMTCVRPYSSGLSEQVDAVAVCHGHDGALRVRAAPRPVARPTLLANTVDRVDARDSDLEHFLDRDLDLGLVRRRIDEERVLVLVEECVALLADDRRKQDVVVVANLEGVAHLSASSSVALAAFLVFGSALTFSALGSAAFSAFAGFSTLSALAGFSAFAGFSSATASTAATASASVEVATALADLPPCWPATNASSALVVKTTDSLTMTSYTLSWSTAIAWTPARLRRLSQATSSSRCRTTIAER